MALAGFGVELDDEAVAGEGEVILAVAEGGEGGEYVVGGGGFEAGEGGEAAAFEPAQGLALCGDAIDAIEIEGQEAEPYVGGIDEALTAEGSGDSVATYGGRALGLVVVERHGFAADFDGAGGAAGQVEEDASAEGGVGAVAATAKVSADKGAVLVDAVDAYAIRFELNHIRTSVAT